MQQLHLVGFTTDLEGLIFAARRGAKSGGFVVALDDNLLEAIDDAFERRAAGEGEGQDGEAVRPSAPLSHRRTPRAESTLTPREIQARLRTGRSISEVAAAAGVDEDWVARFAVPIQAEQAQVVTRVRSLVYSKQRLGPSAQPLGVAVLWNLRDKGVPIYEDNYDEGWSAFHLRDSEWIVRFSYVNRKKAQHAEWVVDLADGEIMSRNRLASELAYIEPGRRRRPAPLTPAPPPPSAPSTSRGAARPAAHRRPATPGPRATAKKAPRATANKARKAAGKKTTKAVAGRRVTSKKAVSSNKAAAKRSPTKKAASARKPSAAKRTSGAKRATAKKPAVAKKTAARKATSRRAPAKRSTAKRAGSRTRAPAQQASTSVTETGTAAPSAAVLRREQRRARRIPPATTAAPRVPLRPVVATSPRRTFVPTPTERPARRVEPTVADEQRRAVPSRRDDEPTPVPDVVEATPERPVPVIVIDDADSSVHRISSRNQLGAGDDGDGGRALTIRAPMAASVAPAAPSSRRFGRRRARREGQA